MQLTHDRWLIPARQCELPGRDLVPTPALHARREWTFLVLASLFLTATVALPFLGDTIVGFGGLTFGLAIFPIALVAAQVVCELYGGARMRALAGAGALGAALLVGLAAIGGDMMPFALALLAYSASAHLANALVYGTARRAMAGHHLWLRSLLSIALAQIVGWSAFLFVIYATGEDVVDLADTAAVAAVFTCGAAIAALLPLSLVRRVLAVYLRVGRTDDDAVDHAQLVPQRRRLPPALIVDDEPEAEMDRSRVGVRADARDSVAGVAGPDDVPVMIVDRPAFRPTLHPFSTGEMAFFAEGENLANTAR